VTLHFIECHHKTHILPGTGGSHLQSQLLRRQRSRSQLGQIASKTRSQKTHHKKRAGGVAQGIGPEFKPQYQRRKKKYIYIYISPNQLVIPVTS
jgi:hypothetical protein